MNVLHGVSRGTRAREKPDLAIVPKRPASNRVTAPAEGPCPKGNGPQNVASWTQSQEIASAGLMAVRQAAQKDKRKQLTALLHHVVDVAVSRKKVIWVLDADIRQFFDSMEHNWAVLAWRHILPRRGRSSSVGMPARRAPIIPPCI